MNDRDDPKIVSLDQRRRDDAARQKAELAAAAAAKHKANGSGRDLNQPFGRPMQGRTSSAPANAGGVGGAVGKVVSAIVWGGLAVMIAVAVWSTLAG